MSSITLSNDGVEAGVSGLPGQDIPALHYPAKEKVQVCLIIMHNKIYKNSYKNIDIADNIRYKYYQLIYHLSLAPRLIPAKVQAGLFFYKAVF